MKAELPCAMDKLIDEAEKENVGSVSKSDFDAIINL